MSLIPPHPPLQMFYRSGPQPCPYLPDRMERKLFTRLLGTQAAAVNATLTQAGFRRSHDIAYRPVCIGCAACVPVRIPVDRFAPGRTMRRLMRHNRDLRFEARPALATDEQFLLFSAYQASRHGDSDMSRMTRGDYRAMVEEGAVDTQMFELRARTAPSNTGGGPEREAAAADAPLLGAMLVDRLQDGYSAVYSFYRPDLPERSLGTQMVLSLVEQARAEGLPHIYLGYWIEHSRKMAYKARFQPLERLGVDGWVDLTLPAPIA